MTLNYWEGFDLQDFVLRGWVVSNGVVSGTTPFALGSSLQSNSSTSASHSATLLLPSAVPFTSRIYVGFAMSASAAASIAQFQLRGDNGVTAHLILVMDSTSIRLCRGTTATVLATAAVAFPQNDTFQYIEMSALIADVGGTCEVRLNGTQIINFTGDTRNAGTTASVSRIDFWLGASAAANIKIDDLYVCDNSGSAPTNTFLGPWARVLTCKPSAAGSSTQFTPVSGSNFSNVNDTPDNTATYNSDTVSGHRDTFALDDLPVGTDLIYGVQQVMHARQLDGGTATIKQAQKSGATVSYGSTKTLASGTAAYLDRSETNPATSVAWTQSDVNALEAGYEIV